MAIQAQRFLNSRTRWILFGFIAVLSAYLLAVTPVRTYLAQRSEIQAVEHRQALLSQANEQLGQRVQALQSDAEIERLARERYDLVPPGTKAYAIMPAPAATPAAKDPEKDRSLWSSIADDLTFWN